MLLFYDLMARYFKANGTRVRVIVNITDIDPKIFNESRAIGMTSEELSSKFINELLFDLSALGIDGFMLGRVSDHVKTAQHLVASLLKKDRAYSVDGSVYLDTSNMPSFGSLAKMTRQDLEDCRLDISPFKRSPADILLWNASENFNVIFCDSTLGKGIPWWHMQDTSVAVASFGGSYDIHGGATELIYPHHESHLAQMRGITSFDKPVRFWTHVGLVNVKGKKMSKSLGNTLTIRDLLRRHSSNAIRLYLFSKHYREDFHFAERDLEKFELIDAMLGAATTNKRRTSRKTRIVDRFCERLEDDFDTPAATRIMIEAAKSRSLSDLSAMVTIFGLRY
jgi:cysteinyl-tRNA synthetase